MIYGFNTKSGIQFSAIQTSAYSTPPPRILRGLVIDSDPLAREKLLRLLSAEEGIEATGAWEGVEEVVPLIERHRPDIVFLSFPFPDVHAAALLDSLSRTQRRVVVFVTTYDPEGLRLLRERDVDYLLKPFDSDRFRAVYRRVLPRLRTVSRAPRVPIWNSQHASPGQ